MWKQNLQRNLRVRADGIIGPVTYTALFARLGARPDVADALARGAVIQLPAYGISDNAGRMAEWFGEMAHESAGFRAFTENLNYTQARRICRVWPSRFRREESAAPYVRAAEKLANCVYSSRMGNGDEASGDGWRYRGRGLIHLTGRANYAAASERLGIDLVGDPGLAAEPEMAVLVACDYWATRGFNRLADLGQGDAISRAINGGSGGITQRRGLKAEFREMCR